MSLTQECRAIILGTMLGDACLERNGRYVRLRVDHGEAQRALVEWKFRQLAELNPSPPRRVEVHDDRTNRVYVHYRFTTRSLEILNEYRDLFYTDQGVKRIHPRILSHLSSALSIAVWYMDDGSRRGDCRSGYFNTQAFAKEEVDLLRFGLLKYCNLSTKTHFAAGRPRIYVPVKQFPLLCRLIENHVIPEMQYKLL